MMRRIVVALAGYLALLPPPAYAQTFAGWSIVETPHFRLQFPPNPHVDSKEFADQLERAHAEIQRILGGAPPGRINFYVWNSSAEAEAVLGRALGFARPDLMLVHAAAGQTRGHELTHVFVHHVFRPEATRRFIEEGIAVALDMSNRDRIGMARQAVKEGGLQRPIITRLWTSAGALDENVVYPIAGAFIDHLARKGGRERLFALLKDQTIERARTIYGGDFDRLVAEFETQLTGAAATSDGTKLEALRARAQARLRRDREMFSEQEVRDLETLYQAANRNIRAPGGKDLLLQVVSKYPRSNRAGCAVLYLAQISSGSERESFLKRAIAEHVDDWYGNGVQVGALARVYLAAHYAETNRRDEAAALAEEVQKSFPDGVDHTGGSLIEMLQRMKLLPLK
jgi:ElaB/YqjD/DUF883 family membrane-anchored ribosome-binding protein